MNKLLIAVAILFFSGLAHASADYTVTWQIEGYLDVNSIKLDLNIGNDFVSANGALIADSGFEVLVTGTCNLTFEGGLFCSLNIGQGVTGILDIDPTLNGNWRVINVNGNVINTATVDFSDLKEG